MNNNFKISNDSGYTYQAFIEEILNNRGRFNCKKGEYKERHHIFPKAEGGNNTTENLIDLYPREHFIAHKLLAQENPDILSYQRAYFCMAFLKNDKEKRDEVISPEEYEKIRLESSAFLKGKNNPNYGNHSLAGENNPYYRKKHTEEILQKIRDGLKGKMVGEKNSMYNKKHSESTKEKLRKASKNRWSKEEEHKKAHAIQEKNKKKVVQYNLNNQIIGIWSFAGAAAEGTGTPKTDIRNTCTRRQKTANGYKWRFLDDVKKDFFIKILKQYDKEWKRKYEEENEK